MHGGNFITAQLIIEIWWTAWVCSVSYWLRTRSLDQHFLHCSTLLSAAPLPVSLLVVLVSVNFVAAC